MAHSETQLLSVVRWRGPRPSGMISACKYPWLTWSTCARKKDRMPSAFIHSFILYLVSEVWGRHFKNELPVGPPLACRVISRSPSLRRGLQWLSKQRFPGKCMYTSEKKQIREGPQVGHMVCGRFPVRPCVYPWLQSAAVACQHVAHKIAYTNQTTVFLFLMNLLSSSYWKWWPFLSGQKCFHIGHWSISRLLFWIILCFECRTVVWTLLRMMGNKKKIMLTIMYWLWTSDWMLRSTKDHGTF